MQFSVRHLKPQDAAIFQEIRLEGLRQHPEAFGASFEEESEQSVSQVAERMGNSAIFGGFDESGRLAGIAAFARARGTKAQHTGFIWGVYVRPEARRSGLSRQLLMSAIDAGADCRSIRLSVVTTNLAAIRLYESLGFQSWAMEREALKVGEVYCDEILMRLDREL